MERKYEDENFKLVIRRDELADNPRVCFDNFGHMVCFHNKYCLGDRHDFSSPKEFIKTITDKNSIILPLYLYDHSGITISTAPFSCPWDSGQIGWIYITKEKAKEIYGVKEITKKIKEKIIDDLKLEVEVYNMYLTNEVYCYKLYKKEGENLIEIDDCGGFYGFDPKKNGILESLPEEANYLLELGDD